MTPRLHSECCPPHSGTSQGTPGEAKQGCQWWQSCLLGSVPAVAWQNQQLQQAASPTPARRGLCSWGTHPWPSVLDNRARPPAAVQGLQEVLVSERGSSGLWAAEEAVSSSSPVPRAGPDAIGQAFRLLSSPGPFLAKPETAGSPPRLSGPLGPTLHSAPSPGSHKPQPRGAPM